MKNNNTLDLLYGVFRRNGVRLVSAVDGSVHFPWTDTNYNFVAFTSKKKAKDFSARVGEGAEVWVLSSGRESSVVELSSGVVIAKGFAPHWAIK